MKKDRDLEMVKRAVSHASLNVSNKEIVSYLETKALRDIEEALDGLRFTVVRLRGRNWSNDEVAEGIVRHIVFKYKEKMTKAGNCLYCGAMTKSVAYVRGNQEYICEKCCKERGFR